MAENQAHAYHSIIQERLQNRNISNRELAKKYGVSEGTVRNWLAGRKLPREVNPKIGQVPIARPIPKKELRVIDAIQQKSKENKETVEDINRALGKGAKLAANSLGDYYDFFIKKVENLKRMEEKIDNVRKEELEIGLMIAYDKALTETIKLWHVLGMPDLKAFAIDPTVPKNDPRAKLGYAGRVLQQLSEESDGETVREETEIASEGDNQIDS